MALYDICLDIHKVLWGLVLCEHKVGNESAVVEIGGNGLFYVEGKARCDLARGGEGKG
jgi:hypothetical protein